MFMIFTIVGLLLCSKDYGSEREAREKQWTATATVGLHKVL
jgi:hypothetical protein